MQEFLGRVGAELDVFLTSPRTDPARSMPDWSKRVNGELPVRGLGADAVLEELVDLIPYGNRVSDPGFWAFVTAGPTTTPLAAFTAGMVASPQRYLVSAFNQMEEVSLDWLARLCGLGSDMKGVYSSGGSSANLVGLGGGRQWAYEQIGVDVAKEGMFGRRGAIYASSEAHHTIQRSAAALGIGRSWVRSIPCDAHQRIDTDALRLAIEADVADGVLPVCVVGTAGTTNTGAIDPLRELGEIAAEFGCWFHVDGAYGLPGVLDARVAERYDGLELVDSVTVDPHKWLGAPVGIAATFVRDRSILHRAFTQEPAHYLEGSFTSQDDIEVSLDHMGVEYGDFGVELSAPARGVMVWSILLELGIDGMTERIVEDIDRARLLTELAREHPRLEALTDPDLSIACVRYSATDSDNLNEELLRRILRETDFMPSSTVVDGAFAIRPCFINARTTDELVRGLAEAMVRLGDELAAG